ncbi:MAG: dimethylsulfonioproprionate lyase family protein [Candidatus Humimicrobiaceae bacterium]
MERKFREADIKKTTFSDRWVKFAFGPQGKIKTGSLNLGIVEFGNNKTSMSHKHDVEEALYVLSGKGKIKIGDKIYNLDHSEFIYIPKNTEHSIITSDCPLKILFIFGGEIVIDH